MAYSSDYEDHPSDEEDNAPAFERREYFALTKSVTCDLYDDHAPHCPHESDQAQYKAK